MTKLVVTLGLALVAVLVPGVPAAHAVGTCSILLPTTVWMDSPTKDFTAHFGDECVQAGAEIANWDVSHSTYGYYARIGLDPDVPHDLTFHDSSYFGPTWCRPPRASTTGGTRSVRTSARSC